MARSFPLLPALVLGCADAPPPPGAPERSPPPAGDSGPIEVSDPGWTLGTPRACDAPVAPGWTEGPTLESDGSATGRPLEGTLLVWPEKDDWRITAPLGHRDLATWTLADPAPGLVRDTHPVQRATLLPHGDAAAPDLVTLGDALVVRPAWDGSPDAPSSTLGEAEANTAYKEAHAVDLDGDGAEELVLGLWRE